MQTQGKQIVLILAAYATLLIIIGAAGRGGGTESKTVVPTPQPTATFTFPPPVQTNAITQSNGASLLYIRREKVSAGAGFETLMLWNVAEQAVKEVRSVSPTSGNTFAGFAGATHATQFLDLRGSGDRERHLYLREFQTPSSYQQAQQFFLKTDLDAHTVYRVPVNLANQQPVFAISADGTKVAWCDVEKGFSIYEFATEISVPVANDRICRLGSSGPTFSRDGRTIYYGWGFYELGDNTDMELAKRTAREAGHGFRAITLASGEDKILIPAVNERNEWQQSPIVLWDNGYVYERQGLFINPYSEAFEVRRLPERPFDYLTSDDIERLPVVVSVTLASERGKRVQGTLITADGKGMFYKLSTQGKQYEELGYVDFASGKKQFPIPVPAFEGSVTIFPSIDENNLFYLDGYIPTLKDGVPNYDTTTFKLYRTDIRGQYAIIEQGEIDPLAIGIAFGK